MKKIIAVSFFVLFIGLVPHTFAATAAAVNTGFTALAPIPGLTDNASASLVNSAGLANFFNNLYKYLIGIAAILAVIEIIYSGIRIATNQDSVSVLTDSKGKIWQAILGLVLVLSPVVVFSIINPSILNLSLNLPALTMSTSTPVTPGSVSSALSAPGCANCGTSLTVVYWAPYLPNLGVQYNPDDGKVTPGYSKPAADFETGCPAPQGLETISLSTFSHACPTGAQITAAFTSGKIGTCFDTTLTCQPRTNQQGQTQLHTGCTTTHSGPYLETATCINQSSASNYSPCDNGLNPTITGATKDTQGNYVGTATVYCGKTTTVTYYAAFHMLVGTLTSSDAVVPHDLPAQNAFISACSADGGKMSASTNKASFAIAVNGNCSANTLVTYDPAKQTGVECYAKTLSCIP